MSFLGQITGGLLDNYFANERQDDAQTFSAQQFASSRYQTTVKDMEAAGLNPALAYQQGGGSPSGGVVSSPGNNFSQIALGQAQIENAKAQTRKTNAEAAVLERTGIPQGEATLAETYSRTGLNSQQISNVEAQTKKIVEEINNLPYERDRLKAAANQLHKLAGLQEMQGLSEPHRMFVLKQQAQQIISQTKLNNLDIDAAESLGNVGRETGQLKPFFDILRGLIRK